jgi:hypothetical protein
VVGSGLFLADKILKYSPKPGGNKRLKALPFTLIRNSPGSMKICFCISITLLLCYIFVIAHFVKTVRDQKPNSN